MARYKTSRIERLKRLESELLDSADELGDLFWDHDDNEPRGPYGREICNAMDNVLQLIEDEIMRRD